MYPKIFGLINSYGLMIGIGVLVCLYVFHTYAKRKNYDPKFIDFVEWNAIIAILAGLGSGVLFQSIYNFIEDPSAGFTYSGITFIGGLLGGVIAFLIGYFAFGRKYETKISDLIMIAPCSITVAHGFGRIGCFLAGCCYGIETDSILGMKFPDLPYKVYPTQLYEAIFLFLLFGIMSLLVLKFNFKHNMPLYLVSYGIFRFLIEFIRGDERGVFIGSLSPSQFWSIVMVVIGIGLFILYQFFFDKIIAKINEHKKKEKEDTFKKVETIENAQSAENTQEK